MPPLPKRWEIAAKAPPDHLARFPDLHPLVVQVLYNRSIKEPRAVEWFLEADEDPVDPFALPGMEAAVSRIRWALERGELIAVYGDFDADGVTATALLVETLRALGGQVQPYIPDRVEEGYGLHQTALTKLSRAGVGLVVTVDCGVRACEEIAAARGLGMDVIVTDHHGPGRRLPDAVAVIGPGWQGQDPEEVSSELAGVGLAYRLAQALLRADRDAPLTDGPVSLHEEELLDLVALGTVADLADLRGENRALVRQGLERINQMDRLGIRALSAQAGLRPGKVDAAAIGYVLGPRINAAGRLADAKTAYRLLVARDVGEAARLAAELENLNRERRRLTAEAHDLARQMVLETTGDGLLLFAADPRFSRGIVGLVASRLLDEFHRPAVVVEMGEEVSRGSCRSIGGFHITEALDRCADLLVRHGGHAAAAGFTVANQHLPPLARRLRAIAGQSLSGRDLTPMLEVDAEAPLSEMSWSLLEALSRLEPCGCGNEQPVFASRGVHVRDQRAVGREGKHLKLTLWDGAATWDAIAFRQGEWAGRLPSTIDVAFHLELNEWRGRRRLQLNVQDVRPAGESG